MYREQGHMRLLINHQEIWAANANKCYLKYKTL